MRKLVWLTIGICSGCGIGVYAFGSGVLLPICLVAVVASVVIYCISKGKTGLVFLGLAVGLCYTVSHNFFYLNGIDSYDGQTISTSITVTD